MMWTKEKDGQLLRLLRRGLSASQVGVIMGISRNAVIGRKHRLDGTVFPSDIAKREQQEAKAAQRRRERADKDALGVGCMRAALSCGSSRPIAIMAGYKAGATLAALGRELGITRQRVEQIAKGV